MSADTERMPDFWGEVEEAKKAKVVKTANSPFSQEPVDETAVCHLVRLALHLEENEWTDHAELVVENLLQQMAPDVAVKLYRAIIGAGYRYTPPYAHGSQDWRQLRWECHDPEQKSAVYKTFWYERLKKSLLKAGFMFSRIQKGRRDNMEASIPGKNGWSITYIFPRHPDGKSGSLHVKEGRRVIVPVRPPETLNPLFVSEARRKVGFIYEFEPDMASSYGITYHDGDYPGFYQPWTTSPFGGRWLARKPNTHNGTPVYICYSGAAKYLEE